MVTMHTTKIDAFSFSKLQFFRPQEVSSSNSGRISTGRGSTRRYDPLVLSVDDHNHCFSSPVSSTNVSAFILSLAIVTNTFGAPSMAVSGGGLDYANIDITGQDFSNNPKSYKGKDFTQVIAKGTNFSNSNLQGCRFYKAYLVNTNFEGSDLRGASLEDTSMDGSNLKNAIVSGAYFSASLLDVATAEGADFTDAQIPVKTLTSFCEKKDIVKGKNPVTGVDTRESLMCLD